VRTGGRLRHSQLLGQARERCGEVLISLVINSNLSTTAVYGPISGCIPK